MNETTMQVAAQELSEVWLVEDNALFRDTLAELIEGTPGFRCTHAFGAGEDAIRALEEGTLPDIVLMDIALPGINGIETVRRIRGMAPSLPIVMLTVHQDNDRIFRAICAGASGYLSKSVPGEEIVGSLRQVVMGGAVIDAQIARRVLDMFAGMSAPQADYGLSQREREILNLLVDGLTKNQIAERLFLSPHTIDGHTRNIYGKLYVHNRSAAVAKALRENLI